MLQFRNYLTEKLEKFNRPTNPSHAEDMVIDYGQSGYHHATETLNNIHSKFEGDFTTTKIATKFSGSPTIIFGYDPETKGFFVGTDKSKIATTPEEVEKKYRGDPKVASMMLAALQNLPKVTPKHGIYGGDIMHTGLKGTVHEHEGEYHFLPKRTLFSVDKKSDEGKKVEKAKLGITVHAKYYGDSLDTMKASGEPDVHNFKDHPHVHVFPTEPDTDFNDSKSSLGFKVHIKNAERAFNKTPVESFDTVKSQKPVVLAFINSSSKEGKPPSVEGYAKYLLTTNVSTAAEKKAAMQRVTFVMDHKKEFESIFNLHRHIQKAKNSVVDALDQNPTYRYSDNGEEKKGEGYTATHNGHPVKLVNREKNS